jgi:hypothetical protein
MAKQKAVGGRGVLLMGVGLSVLWIHVGGHGDKRVDVLVADTCALVGHGATSYKM